ncbi:methyltransferase [Amycolatopsis sp. WQ 127309]|uniref:methyltransferase n=1 Tax=Amycolatopsis sp. WQ 127309 TaxID=2932773 RepID=UPI001FF3A49B|nr:methyltransferase [Amycolatopsis sp. WQ 127309]UOZ03331.1 methyltransferase domain-containing protein [Amycolatopsis sp. WQ 127309]
MTSPGLILLSGLPATGRSTVAVPLARALTAAYLRIDTIGDAVGRAVARDQLGTGLGVVVEGVNPLKVTRDAWKAVGDRHAGWVLEVEFAGSGTGEQCPGREHEPWDRAHLVIDTAVTSVSGSVELILRHAYAAAGSPMPALSVAAGLATPMSLRVAATFRLADLAGEDGATAEALASAARVSESALRRLLDHLVTAGVFCFDSVSGRYLPTALGRQLRDDHPDGIRADLDVTTAIGRAELAFTELPETVVTGEPAYPRRYGRGFWADLEKRPRLQESFDTKMSRRFRIQAEQIARRFDWSRFGSVIDVGGGDGTLLSAVLHAHRGVRGRVLDLPPTAGSARERFAREGLDDRAEAVAGSFFDPLPSRADAYVLSDVLHDWSDDESRAILRGCARVARGGGVVIVIESLRTGVAGQVPTLRSICSC